MASHRYDQGLQAIQNEILEMIAYGEPLPAVATALCERIEEIAPEAICSVLTVDAQGRLHPLAAPRLPESFSQTAEGQSIGPRAGSCGAAAYRGEPVLAVDISTDPLWEDLRGLAEPLGLKACWSSPIKARGGRVIGTFALYYRSKRAPSPLERHLIDACLHVCAIAIEHHDMQARNHQLAYFDMLTGLPNRFHADVLAKQRIAAASEGLGLLLLDIDNLKTTNDTLGHAVGDELIRQVAARVSAAVAPGTACRIGGDEFVAIVEDCGRPGALRAIAERILAGMETPFVFKGHTIVPNVTIGGVLYGRDGDDIETLRQNADLALYHSKDTGRGRFVEFDEELRTAMTRRVERIREVEAALDEGRITAHYQPIVRLDSGEIVGLEALARIVAPEGGVVAAGEFAAALQEQRVARRLTAVMLEKVARDVGAWLRMGIPFQHVGVNVTTPDFEGDGLAGRIAAAFGRESVPLRHVILEVTETVLVGGSDCRVASAVERLRSQGLRVALDDFGTGYASLTHLLTLPVDVIKIDKCFVTRLVEDEASGVIVSALIDIARRLDMRIVAEGIETPPQAERLAALGCMLGQGFSFFRPASFEETTLRLLRHAQGMSKPRADGVAGRNVA